MIPTRGRKKNIMRQVMRVFIWVILLIGIAGAVLATVFPVIVGTPDRPESEDRPPRPWRIFSR